MKLRFFMFSFTIFFVCGLSSNARKKREKSASSQVTSRRQHHQQQLLSGREGRPSFLWRIEREPPAYFYGTIHVPYTKVWPQIPTNSKDALTSSDKVVFELDLTDEETMTSLNDCQLLEEGRRLSDVLPPEMMRRLADHIARVKMLIPDWLTDEQKRKGFSADMIYEMTIHEWERKKPIWVNFILQSLTRSETRSRHLPWLDLFLTQQAADTNRQEVASIESAQEQCTTLDGLDAQLAVYALNRTLNLVEEQRKRSGEEGGGGKIDVEAHIINHFIHKYNTLQLTDVDLNFASALAIESNNMTSSDDDVTERIDEYFKVNMNLKRSERMSERVQTLLEREKKKQIVFVFGVGHFLGADSVIEIMGRTGRYNITRMPARFRSRRASSPGNHRKRAWHERHHDGDDDVTISSSSLPPTRSQAEWRRYLFNDHPDDEGNGSGRLRTQSPILLLLFITAVSFVFS